VNARGRACPKGAAIKVPCAKTDKQAQPSPTHPPLQINPTNIPPTPTTPHSPTATNQQVVLLEDHTVAYVGDHDGFLQLDNDLAAQASPCRSCSAGCGLCALSRLGSLMCATVDLGCHCTHLNCNALFGCFVVAFSRRAGTSPRRRAASARPHRAPASTRCEKLLGGELK